MAVRFVDIVVIVHHDCLISLKEKVNNEAHLYSYIVYIPSSLYTIHFDPAIVLSIFML